MRDLSAPLAVLEDLIAIPSVPGTCNQEWLDYVTARMEEIGARVTVIPAPDGQCSGMIASIGPDVPGGIVLSGHADVVSATDQDWTTDPFALRRTEDRVYGRGTTDMKGFLACAIASLEEAAKNKMDRPVHLAISADEETNCQSAISLAQFLADEVPPPRGVIVGEPTGLAPANHHKGSYTYEVEITGQSAHASTPEKGVSAIAIAAHLISWIDHRSAKSFSPEATTFSVGRIEGGTASNIIAARCWFEWDIRLGPGQKLETITRDFQREATRLCAAFENAKVELQQTGAFPGFLTPTESDFAQECLNASIASAFCGFTGGTEAGIYQAAGLPAIVMGPGHIAQAHIADEFLALDQIEGCMNQLGKLL